ncbi:MAG: ABC transporter ATP-binding protein [Fervidicoccaceae archaeon]|jgi:branched-chain amino acid transport system ATP-binding protein
MSSELSLANVTAGYGEFVILHSVSLEVPQKKITALVGPNGAGKTTTLKTIMGMTRLREGNILFEGEDITKLPTYRRVELGISLIPEGRGLFPSLTVRENLVIGAYTKKAREKIQESMEIAFSIFPKLKQRLEQKAGTLSGGEAQMLAIARGLMSRPKVLLLDEPSQGLAPVVVMELFQAIKKLNDELGITVLLVEQHVKESLELAEMAYVMEQGSIVMKGRGSELLADPSLKKAYLVY